ncbi:hypothetical protein GCM10028807_32770 [Spirosoma daeguense]
MLTNQTYQALSLDSPPTIRQYFEKVLQLAQSGVPFPANLDEVWPLVYDRKDMAVRSLKADFMQHVDYQSLRKSPEKTKGRQIEEYYISIPCLEWFVARKVREIFEVYREVFHRWGNSLTQFTQKQEEGLVQVVNTLLDEVVGLKGKLDRVHKARTKYFQAKVIERKQQDRQKEQSAAKVKRDEVVAMISRRCDERYYTSRYATLWKDLWEDFEKYYCIDIHKAVRYKGEHLIDVAVRNGYINSVHELASSKR